MLHIHKLEYYSLKKRERERERERERLRQVQSDKKKDITEGVSPLFDY